MIQQFDPTYGMYVMTTQQIRDLLPDELIVGDVLNHGRGASELRRHYSSRKQSTWTTTLA